MTSSPLDPTAADEEIAHWPEASLRLLARVGQIVSDGLVVVEPDGRVRWLNPAAQRLTGLTLPQARGRRWQDVVQSVSGLAEATPPRRGRLRHRQASVLVSVLWPGDDRTPSVYLLRRSGRAPRSGAESSTALLAALAREIRGPLAEVVAALEAVATGAEATDVARLHDARFTLLGIQNLVENLLLAASFLAGSARITPVPTLLRPMIDAALEHLQPLLERKQQWLAVDPLARELVVLADRARISQVLVNLVTNAMKYGPPGRPISLECTVVGTSVRIAVRDEGPGIPLADQPYLFDRFLRADPRLVESGAGGAGLGLAVVRAIVEGHGGSAGVDTQPGQGTVCWFTLPLAPGTSTPTSG